jgi:FkbM family methyltransferase
MLRVFPKELQVIKKFIKKSDVVFDVGACEGEWTWEVKEHTHVVAHCFEPIPKSFAKLQDNLEKRNHAFLNNCGVSDVVGEKDFYWYEQAPGASGYFRRIELKKLIF